MVNFIRFLICAGLIAFSAYEIIQLVRVIKERKKAKSVNKELPQDDRNTSC